MMFELLFDVLPVMCVYRQAGDILKGKEIPEEKIPYIMELRRGIRNGGRAVPPYSRLKLMNATPNECKKDVSLAYLYGYELGSRIAKRNVEQDRHEYVDFIRGDLKRFLREEAPSQVIGILGLGKQPDIPQ